MIDCDGVLVDSEVIAYRVFAECLNEAGVMLNVERGDGIRRRQECYGY